MFLVLVLFSFNVFATGLCHASWHSMSDLKHFHTHGHRNVDKSRCHSLVRFERRDAGGYHHYSCPFFDACAKAPRQQIFHGDRVMPVPTGPDMACPRHQAPVPDYFHTSLVYRGPPVSHLWYSRPENLPGNANDRLADRYPDAKKQNYAGRYA